MRPVDAEEKDGKLALDEPSDVAEASDETAAGDELDGEERASLHQSIAMGVTEADMGLVVSDEELSAWLSAVRKQPDEVLDPGWLPEIEGRIADIADGRVTLLDEESVHAELRTDLCDPPK